MKPVKALRFLAVLAMMGSPATAMADSIFNKIVDDVDRISRRFDGNGPSSSDELTKTQASDTIARYTFTVTSNVPFGQIDQQNTVSGTINGIPITVTTTGKNFATYNGNSEDLSANYNGSAISLQQSKNDISINVNGSAFRVVSAQPLNNDETDQVSLYLNNALIFSGPADSVDNATVSQVLAALGLLPPQADGARAVQFSLSNTV